TPVVTSGSRGRYRKWSLASMTTISAASPSRCSRPRAAVCPANPAPTTTMRGTVMEILLVRRLTTPGRDARPRRDIRDPTVTGPTTRPTNRSDGVIDDPTDDGVVHLNYATRPRPAGMLPP